MLNSSESLIIRRLKILLVPLARAGDDEISGQDIELELCVVHFAEQNSLEHRTNCWRSMPALHLKFSSHSLNDKKFFLAHEQKIWTTDFY